VMVRSCEYGGPVGERGADSLDSLGVIFVRGGESEGIMCGGTGDLGTWMLVIVERVESGLSSGLGELVRINSGTVKQGVTSISPFGFLLEN